MCDVAKPGPKPKPPEERADQRLSVALTRADKALIDKAAAMTGESTSRFILKTAVRRAKAVVKKSRGEG